MDKTALKGFHLPRYQELPQIGLYLDQTVQYVNGYLMPLGFSELTPSMVSNYVKKGLLKPPVKKQYDSDQLATLFFIAAAKRVLMIDDIKALLQMQQATYPLHIAYDYFCDELENMLFFTFGIKNTVEEIGFRHSEEKTILRSLIIAVSQLIYLHSCMQTYS